MVEHILWIHACSWSSHKPACTFFKKAHHHQVTYFLPLPPSDPWLNRGWRKTIPTWVCSFGGLHWWDEVSQPTCSWPPKLDILCKLICLILALCSLWRWLNVFETHLTWIECNQCALMSQHDTEQTANLEIWLMTTANLSMCYKLPRCWQKLAAKIKTTTC